MIFYDLYSIPLLNSQPVDELVHVLGDEFEVIIHNQNCVGRGEKVGGNVTIYGRLLSYASARGIGEGICTYNNQLCHATKHSDSRIGG
jgi:hypothetical protein